MIKRWLVFLLLLVLPVLLLFQINFVRVFTDNEYDKLKDQVELISWLFAGVVAMVAFLSLFIGFLYENKMIAASNIRRQLYHPYSLSLTDIRQNLLSYERNISGSRLIKYIYYNFVLVSTFTIFIWGTAVGFYTQFQFSHKVNFSIESVLNFGIYAFYALLCFLLFGVTFLLNQLRNNKDPLGSGYLPTTKDLCNIDHLIKAGCDLDELSLKLGPSLEFFKNPPFDNPTYEMNFHLPIKLSNLRFVIKLYDKDRRPLVKCYGIINTVTFIGEKVLINLTNDLSESVYLALQEESTGEFKLYDSELTVISRINLKLSDSTNEGFSFKASRVIYQRDSIELDKGLLEDITDTGIKYLIER